MPEIAADKCSETHVFAVPGIPTNNNARSVAKVATATSIKRRLPKYLASISVPSSNVPPNI